MSAATTAQAEQDRLIADAMSAARAYDATAPIRARASGAEFCGYALRDERTGKPVVLAPMHYEWHALMDACPRLIIWSAVEHGKTQQVSIGRTVYELGRDTSKRVCVLSKTQGQAVKITRTIARYIERSQDVRRVFPDLLPATPWTSTALTVQRAVYSKDPSVQALGVNGAVVGSRIDRLIVDDILDWKNTRTPAQRAETRAWFQSEIVGRLTDEATVWIVGNAYHPEDLLHELSRGGTYVHVKYPVENPDGSPRFPRIWSPQRIAAKRAELGPAEAARQLDCVARKDTDARCQEAWTIQCLERGIDKPLMAAFPPEALPPGAHVYTGVDLAMGTGARKKKESAKSVIFTMLAYPDKPDGTKGDRRLLALSSGRWTAKEIRERVVARWRAFGGLVLVEDNGAQTYLVEALEEADAEFAYWVCPFTTGVNKWHPTYGVESLFAEFAAARWIIPATRVRGRAMAATPEIEEWLAECVNYSPERHTGDHLMASFFAREGARRPEKYHGGADATVAGDEPDAPPTPEELAAAAEHAEELDAWSAVLRRPSRDDDE